MVIVKTLRGAGIGPYQLCEPHILARLAGHASGFLARFGKKVAGLLLRRRGLVPGSCEKSQCRAKRRPQTQGFRRRGFRLKASGEEASRLAALGQRGERLCGGLPLGACLPQAGAVASGATTPLWVGGGGSSMKGKNVPDPSPSPHHPYRAETGRDFIQVPQLPNVPYVCLRNAARQAITQAISRLIGELPDAAVAQP